MINRRNLLRGVATVPLATVVAAPAASLDVHWLISSVEGEVGYDLAACHDVDSVFIDGKVIDEAVIRLDTRAGYADLIFWWSDAEQKGLAAMLKYADKSPRGGYVGSEGVEYSVRVYGEITLTWHQPPKGI